MSIERKNSITWLINSVLSIELNMAKKKSKKESREKDKKKELKKKELK